MKGKLPWWLVVILGWVVIVAVGAAFLFVASLIPFTSLDTPAMLRIVGYILLVAALLIALGLAGAATRVLLFLASSHKRACLLGILLGPVMIILYLFVLPLVQR
jgi:hypothetical protein